MSDNAGNNKSSDKEAILIALDQLSQTMDVMSQVVARLKRTVEQAQFSEQLKQFAEAEKSAQAVKRYYQRKHATTKAKEGTVEPNVPAPIIIH